MKPQTTNALLAALGIAGVAGTAVTSVMADIKAQKILSQIENSDEMPFKEKAKITWKEFIVPGTFIVGTTSIIFSAAHINRKNLASLSSAVGLISSAYSTYKGKVKQMYGEDLDKTVSEDIARDNAPKHYDLGHEKALFFDEYSMRYFESTVEDVINAEADLRTVYAEEGRVSVNLLYEFLGIPELQCGNEFGWSEQIAEDCGYKETGPMFDHHLVVMEDGLECYILHPVYEPHFDYKVK